MLNYAVRENIYIFNLHLRNFLYIIFTVYLLDSLRQRGHHILHVIVQCACKECRYPKSKIGLDLVKQSRKHSFPVSVVHVA